MARIGRGRRTVSSEPFSFRHSLHMRTTSKRWRFAAILSLVALVLTVAILAVVLSLYVSKTEHPSEKDATEKPKEEDVVDANNETIPGCFPAGSMVFTESGRRTRIEDLQIGDRVLDSVDADRLVYTEVYAWLRMDDLQHDFVRLTTDQGTGITLTPNHLIFRSLHPRQSCLMLRREAVLAARIRPGDLLFVQTIGRTQSHCQQVTKVQRVSARGAYAPATMSGTLIVDNVHVSCYTSYWFFDLVGHRFIDAVVFAPLKLAYKLMTVLCPESNFQVVANFLLKPADGALWFVDCWKLFRTALS